MRVIGLTQQEQDEIFRMLAIILWLGNVQFVENDGGYAQISDSEGKYNSVFPFPISLY
jgi:myosin-1